MIHLRQDEHHVQHFPGDCDVYHQLGPQSFTNYSSYMCIYIYILFIHIYNYRYSFGSPKYPKYANLLIFSHHKSTFQVYKESHQLTGLWDLLTLGWVDPVVGLVLRLYCMELYLQGKEIYWEMTSDKWLVEPLYKFWVGALDCTRFQWPKSYMIHRNGSSIPTDQRKDI